MKKSCKKLAKKNSEQKRQLKVKVINCMSNGKDMTIRLIVGLIKKTLNEIPSYKNESIRNNRFRNFGGNINFKVDLSNYARKTDLKNVTHIDTWSFVLKTNLASLKPEVDKLDIEKLAPVPVDLSKLSDVVKNDVVKKTVYDKLAAKVNNIDTGTLVLKTKDQTNKIELGKKIPNVTDFVKRTKLTESENEIQTTNTNKNCSNCAWK